MSRSDQVFLHGRQKVRCVILRKSVISASISSGFLSWPSDTFPGGLRQREVQLSLQTGTTCDIPTLSAVTRPDRLLHESCVKVNVVSWGVCWTHRWELRVNTLNSSSFGATAALNGLPWMDDSVMMVERTSNAEFPADDGDRPDAADRDLEFAVVERTLHDRIQNSSPLCRSSTLEFDWRQPSWMLPNGLCLS